MTIQTMQIELNGCLSQCTTALEKSCCIAIGGREIREAAQLEFLKKGFLSPVSLAIAEKHGFTI